MAREMREVMMEPGGTYECPREGCDGFLFHLYEDDGALAGMTCCFCDHHEFWLEAVRARRAANAGGEG